MPLDRLPSMPQPGPEQPIVRLKASQTRSFIAIGHSVVVYRTHWDAKHRQTIPCFTPHEECEGHLKRMPQRAKGYLHCFQVKVSQNRPVLREECFLELTPVAANDLWVGCGNPLSMRGAYFSVTRRDGAKAHLVVAVWAGKGVPMEELPAVKSPYESVMRMWGFLDFPPENPDESNGFNRA